MKARTLILAVVFALALAPAAPAKEITGAEICGPDGCTRVDDADGRFALMEGGLPRTPPTPAPYYEVNLEIDHRGAVSYTVVPDRRAFRADDGAWYEMPPRMVVAVSKPGRRAFPAAGLIGAAPTPEPRAVTADTGNPLWPEGVVIALVLAGAGPLLLRASRRRFPQSVP